MVNNTIGVIGIGRLGLSFALLAERSGYKVIGYDNREDYIMSLVDGSHKTSEPYINDWLPNADKLGYTNELEGLVYQCDTIFCFVATPSLPDGSYDHSAIDDIVNQLQELHVKGLQMDNKVLVIGCTTVPGYTKSIAERLESIGMKVAYNPEFIAQGDIINGLKNADMVLIGCTEESTLHSLTGIYRTIMTKEPVIKSMSPTAAEITKIGINCYLTMKITYANMIGEIAINSGIEREVSVILQAIGSDSRIGNKFLNYGYGFSGVCLPRDNRALGVYMEDVNIKARIPSTIDNINTAHARYLLEYYIKLNPDKSVPFIFSYISYKKGIDILTESAPYQLCKDLLTAGYIVVLIVSDNIMKQVIGELAKYSDRVMYSTDGMWDGESINGIKINI